MALNWKRVVTYDYPPGQGVQTKVFVVGLMPTTNEDKTKAFLQRLIAVYYSKENATGD